MPQKDYIFNVSYDRPEIDVVCSRLGRAIQSSDDVSAVAVHAQDGDYVDIAICCSSRPFDIDAEFELVMKDAVIIPADQRKFQTLGEIEAAHQQSIDAPSV
jgi:hypothetical protein